MKLQVIALALAFTGAGCVGPQEATQPPVASAEPASPPGYRLRYKSWTGISPGAGFIHTSLRFVELDLAKGKIRRLWKSASHPSPMLPHDDTGIAKLVAHIPWTDLTPEQVSGFRECISAWLATKPPPTYNCFMGLGREDGHVTSLAVTWGTNAVTTTLLPRGGYREDDPLNPSDEWKALLELLVAASPSGVGILQTIKEQ